MRYIFIFILLIAQHVKGASHLGLHMNLEYMRTNYHDKQLLLKVHLIQGYYDTFTDSFWVKQGASEFLHQFDFAHNFAPDVVKIDVYRQNGTTLLGHYNGGFSLQASTCGGYKNDAPLEGKTCDSYTDSGAGTLCASLKIFFEIDHPALPIRNGGGHFSRPFEIYCLYDGENFEAPLKLRVPCAMEWQNKGANCHWYQSTDKGKTWQFADTGLHFFPAKSSYHGGVLYGLDHYYKVKVDKMQHSGDTGVWSLPIGRVQFFLGMKPDSIKVNEKGCAQRKDIQFFYKDDTLRKYNYGPRIWAFYKHPDSASEVRLKLDTFVIKSPISLGDRPFINESKGNLKFRLNIQKGRYRIMYDFTPWNGFTCKLFFDTVYVEENAIPFTPAVSQTKNITCYGANNAELKIYKTGSDTGVWNWSEDGTNYNPAPATLYEVKPGVKHIYAKNSIGCVIPFQINIQEPPIFYSPIKIDTILCNQQHLFVDIAHPNANYYEVKSAGKSVYKTDTFTLSHGGTYVITRKDSHACEHNDTIQITRKNIDIYHDFLIPTKAFITDSVFAVDVSKPEADKSKWVFSDNRINSLVVRKFTNKMNYPDTGTYTVTLHNNYEGCGFTLQKKITIVGKTDSNKIDTRYGYKGPLIQNFEINPNPNDGQNFKIKVTLRDTANIVVYKIDPVSGDILGDIDFYNKKYYEFAAFKSYTETIFFLKLVAGNETKTIKVVVIP